MGHRRRVCPRADERGSVLLAALVGMAALSAIALAVAALASVDTAIAETEQARLTAVAAADAALEGAIASLAAEDDWSAVLVEARRSGLLAASPEPRMAGWGVLDRAALTRAVQRRADAQVEWGANRGVWRLYLEGSPGALASRPLDRATPYALVWIADDEADGDGAPLSDSNGMLSVRVEAFGVRRSKAVVLATVRRATAGVELIGWRSELADG